MKESQPLTRTLLDLLGKFNGACHTVRGGLTVLGLSAGTYGHLVPTPMEVARWRFGRLITTLNVVKTSVRITINCLFIKINSLVDCKKAFKSPDIVLVSNLTSPFGPCQRWQLTEVMPL